MNKKVIYYASILLVSCFLFLILRKVKQARALSSEENTLVATNNSTPPLPSNIEKKIAAPIGKQTAVKIRDLEGMYWSDPYIKANRDITDRFVYFQFYTEDRHSLKVSFYYYKSIVDLDGEEMGVEREDGSSTLTPLSDTVFIIDEPYLEHDFLYVIKRADQIGLSFDGKTIDFYKNQTISPELSPRALLMHFYDGFRVGKDETVATAFDNKNNTIRLSRTDYFETSNTKHALVFFEETYTVKEYQNKEYHSSFLSIAKFKKEASGMRLCNFSRPCPAGYYSNSKPSTVSDEIKKYPTLQKVGQQYFLLKKTLEQDDALNTIILEIYDVNDFKEMLSIRLETYKVNALGEKEYTMKRRFDFPEDENECAIIIHHDSTAGHQENFQLKQDIYLFEKESNAFVKAE